MISTSRLSASRTSTIARLLGTTSSLQVWPARRIASSAISPAGPLRLAPLTVSGATSIMYSVSSSAIAAAGAAGAAAKDSINSDCLSKPDLMTVLEDGHYGLPAPAAKPLHYTGEEILSVV